MDLIPPETPQKIQDSFSKMARMVSLTTDENGVPLTGRGYREDGKIHLLGIAGKVLQRPEIRRRIERYRSVRGSCGSVEKAAKTDEQNLLTSPDEVKEILENVKEALENFDTLLVDEAVEEMGKMHFPDNQKELFKKRKKPPKPRISSFARRLSRSGNDFCKQKIKQKSIPVINFAGNFLISSSFC